MNHAAYRVVRRYRNRSSAVLIRDEPSTSEIMSDGGVVSTADLTRLLKSRYGQLFRMQMRPSLEGAPNTIAWEAHDENANVVSGKIILHANLAADRIEVWAEVLIDGAGTTRRASTGGSGNPIAVLGDHLVATDEIKAALEKRYGELQDVRVWTALVEPPAPIVVEAVMGDGRTIWAEVVINAAVEGAGVICRAELHRLPERVSVVASSLPRQIMQSRLEEIAVKARRLLQQVRAQPQTMGHSVVGDIVRIVEIAEQE